MTNTTADITVSSTRHTTTYESAELEITLAVVYRRAGRWHACCYFGPDSDEYDEEIRPRRDQAEAIALRYAHDMVDAL